VDGFMDVRNFGEWVVYLHWTDEPPAGVNKGNT
jgi:hypothetical protein